MNISSALFPGLTKICCQFSHKYSLFKMTDYLDFDYWHIFAKEPAICGVKNSRQMTSVELYKK